MKYYINYTNEGKILGFSIEESDTDLNIEVSNEIWFKGQSYNKIIIDGDNISFDKVDWRSSQEIEAEQLAQSNTEAIKTLNSTDWKVIRELERLMLAGTELNAEREALREAVK